jgi:hypothetical protein
MNHLAIIFTISATVFLSDLLGQPLLRAATCSALRHDPRLAGRVVANPGAIHLDDKSPYRTKGVP